jgi:hypothetical protein
MKASPQGEYYKQAEKDFIILQINHINFLLISYLIILYSFLINFLSNYPIVIKNRLNRYEKKKIFFF